MSEGHCKIKCYHNDSPSPSPEGSTTIYLGNHVLRKVQYSNIQELCVDIGSWLTVGQLSVWT